ncbi:MAG: DUF1822 family protein [Cyanobacteria bacterium P01_C01_bin.72]
MDLEIALEFVNQVLKNEVNRDLRPPEITVFCGTWQGITYEQMAESSAYSANYLMRDVAPKFWKLLSTVFAENIGKSNLKIQLRKLYDLPQGELEILNNLEWKRQNTRESWQSAVTTASVFYGREVELETVSQWVTEDSCQLIKIWGLSGTGKTLLMKKIGEQLQQNYELVFWRSLVTAPKLDDFAADILLRMGIMSKSSLSPLSRLMEQMRSRSCLIMLDGLESILQAETLNGQYRHNYDDYRNFFQLIGNSSHPSCVIVTSLENFGATLADSSEAVREFQLGGLGTAAAQNIFNINQIGATSVTAKDLIDYYQGNPAILNFVAQIISKLFNGNLEEFTTQQSLVFGEINQLLNKSFTRLSTLETEILYWLASESKPISLSEIQTGIPLSIYPQELIEALESLNQRSLIAVTQVEQRSVFDLSPMVREFVINQFITQISSNFSLANRQNIPLAQETIELGNISQTSHLSQWLENRFEPEWQPIETLFTASERSPTRLRSAFSLRGAAIVRFKQIALETAESKSILLVIAISELEARFKICVQVQPSLQAQTLPEQLELRLQNPADTVLASISTQAGNHFIQLPYFRGAKNEEFTIEIVLQSSSYREKFLI